VEELLHQIHPDRVGWVRVIKNNHYSSRISNGERADMKSIGAKVVYSLKFDARQIFECPYFTIWDAG